MRVRLVWIAALLCLASGSAFGQLVLSSAPNPSTLGQTVFFSASGAPSGTTVTFYDGGLTSNNAIGSGSTGAGTSASFNTSNLSAGIHSVQACYVSAFAGNVCSNFVSQQVLAPTPTFTLSSSPNPSNFGQPVVFTAGPVPSFSQVTFYDGGSGGTVIGSGSPPGNSPSGSVSITVSNLSPGSHGIVACYVESGAAQLPSAVCSNTVNQFVNPLSSSLSLTSTPNPSTPCQSVTFTATVTPNTATGSVSFTDGTTPIGSATVKNGSASLTVASLTLGVHQIQARYTSDTQTYAGSSAGIAQTVTSTATATLSSGPNPSIVGQSVSISVTVSGVACAGTSTPTPTGSVAIFDGGTQIGAPNLSGGSASISTSSLTAGSHSLSARYSGDSNYSSVTSNSVTQVVNPPTKTNTTTTLAASPNPVTSGQTLTLTATVSPSAATGTVQFFADGNSLGTVNLANGAATITTSSLAAGSHSLSANYSGDANFNSSSGSTSVTVNPPAKTNTTTTVSASPNPVNSGQTLTVTATVSPSGATGTVQFFADGNSLGTVNLASGAATITTSSLAAGSHTLSATYSGDANFNSSSGSTSVTVTTPNKTNTTTTVSASPNPVNSGQTLTVTATVSPSGATGTVQFFADGNSLGTVTLANGAATITTSSLAAGSHTLSASYSGDANFNSSSGSTSVTVNPPANQPTTTTLSVSPNPANLGQTVTMTAVVSPSSATGTVNFRDGSSTLGTVNLVNGTASLSTSSLAAGLHSITASYSGNSSLQASSSNSVSLLIVGPTTQTSLTSSPNPSTFGQTVQLTATVTGVNGSGTPTGTIAFNDGGTNLATVNLTGGTATFSISTLSVGSHTLTASYSGDATFATSVSPPINQQVNKGVTVTTLSASPTSVGQGQGVLLTAKVTPLGATGTVTFLDGGTSLGTAALVAGTASTTTSFSTNGNHSITAVYNGDTNYATSTSAAVMVSVGLPNTTTALSASATTINVGQSVTFTATVSPTGATGTVTFLDNGSSLGTGTLAAGTATLTTSSLTAGSHSITAMYGGDSNFGASTSSPVTVTVGGKTNSTTTLSASAGSVASGQPVTLRASVTPTAATGIVTFLDSGASLGTGSLTSGTASLTVSLTTGTHTITASYGGDTNTNGSTSGPVTVVVNPGTVLGGITPSALPNAFVGQAYSQTFTVTGGTAPLMWTLASGSVPGLTLSAGGVLSGTPTTAGTTSLTIRVQDSANPALATAIVVSLTVLPQLPAVQLTAPTVIVNTDQPVVQANLSPAYPQQLVGTFTLSFTPNASNLPANYVNPDVKFITGGITSPNITFVANSTAPVPLPAIQLGTVAGTVTVTLTSLTLSSTGQSVLPSQTVFATLTVPRSAPVIVPGSVKIINITSTGFSVFLDGTTTTRELVSASLTFTAATGAQLNGASETISLTSASTAWFSDTGAGRGVANGGAFSLTIPFNYTGDPTAIGTVSVTITNTVGTSAAVSGGR